jgi:hypothetical protein
MVKLCSQYSGDRGQEHYIVGGHLQAPAAEIGAQHEVGSHEGQPQEQAEGA